MGAFTKTIANGLRCFGPGPSTKYGDGNGAPYTGIFGTSKWGEGESLPISFIKVISNSQALTWNFTGASVVKGFAIGSVSPSFEMSSEQLTQGSWYYVFTSDTTQGEQRDFATWTSATVSDATFTCQAAAGTSWSEV